MNYPPAHMVSPMIARPGGALPPSPPHSLTKSSNGSGPYTMSSSSEGRKPPSPQLLEQQLLEHHRALTHFLAASAANGAETEESRPHHRARDKLLRLSPIQFQELSTDVYDELLRRGAERRVRPGTPDAATFPTFLLPKPNFHPKRNQARQKLATLAVVKFKELVTDVLFELERRYPQFASVDHGPIRSPGSHPGSMKSRARSGSRARSTSRSSPASNAGLPSHIQGLRRPSNPIPPMPPYSPTSPTGYGPSSPSGYSSNEYGRAVPKAFTNGQQNDGANGSGYPARASSDYGGEPRTARSSQRTTNKSLPYAVEEHPMPEFQEQISVLEQKVTDLGRQLKETDYELEQSRSLAKGQEQTLEAERSKSSMLITDVESQLQTAENLNSSLQTELRNLKSSHTRLQDTVASNGGSDEWRIRYQSLERDYHKQQQFTEEVRSEALKNLQEMRVLAERASHATDQEEILTRQVSQLEIAVTEWKNRFTKAKAQLRNVRALSTPFQAGVPLSGTLFGNDASITDPQGLVKDISVTQYQIAVEELLQISRGGDPAAVLQYMRTMLSSVRAVTEDVDTGSASSSEDVVKLRTKLKARVSNAANNLITAAKNYSSGGGLSPVSLVDAAATNLTAAVVDLVKEVKVRPTPVGELDDGEAVSNLNGVSEEDAGDGWL